MAKREGKEVGWKMWMWLRACFMMFCVVWFIVVVVVVVMFDLDICVFRMEAMIVMSRGMEK